MVQEKEEPASIESKKTGSLELGQDGTHLPAATPASLTARVMRTWSLIDTTDSHLVIVVVGNLRELPCDTHVILASGTSLDGTGC